MRLDVTPLLLCHSKKLSVLIAYSLLPTILNPLEQSLTDLRTDPVTTPMKLDVYLTEDKNYDKN